jgi:hypothetical protein
VAKTKDTEIMQPYGRERERERDYYAIPVVIV